jgi:glycosyltransferase involved in cell wall biosynthesis
MNILLCSVPFRPSVGGIETVSALLAECFHRAGHHVVVVTQTPNAGPDAEGFELVRQPSAARMFELVRWADVVFHNTISLKFAWPQWLLRRPWVVAHHTWIPAAGVAAGLKRWAIRHASNIAVSHALAESLPVECTVVPNPYADDVFVRDEVLERSRELVFVGRLVSQKGVGVLIDALGLLAKRGRRPGLMVIGEGPELPALRRQVYALGITSQVHFVGRRTGADLVAALNEHRVLIGPSLGQEAFGVVALANAIRMARTHPCLGHFAFGFAAFRFGLLHACCDGAARALRAIHAVHGLGRVVFHIHGLADWLHLVLIAVCCTTFTACF